MKPAVSIFTALSTTCHCCTCLILKSNLAILSCHTIWRSSKLFFLWLHDWPKMMTIIILFFVTHELIYIWASRYTNVSVDWCRLYESCCGWCYKTFFEGNLDFDKIKKLKKVCSDVHWCTCTKMLKQWTLILSKTIYCKTIYCI